MKRLEQRTEYGAIKLQERTRGKVYGVFVGRITSESMIRYVQGRAVLEKETETAICNRILNDAISRLLAD
jgi:hypothetical protein